MAKKSEQKDIWDNLGLLRETGRLTLLTGRQVFRTT
jgi:hypothetical protein